MNLQRFCRVAILMILSGMMMTSEVGNVQAVSAAPRYGGSFVVGLTTDPTSWNPTLHMSASTFMRNAQIHNALINFDMKGQPAPGLAESWEISKDSRTMTFHLFRNVKWHDGKDFTSADVKFCFEKVLIPYHPAGKINFGVIASIETPDPYTVVFKLSKPALGLIYFMGMNHAAIVAKHLFEGTDVLTNPQNTDKPIGTGPFVFKEYVKGSHAIMVRNDKYFRKGLPYIDRLVFRTIPDPAARVMALEKGEIDALMGPTPVDYSELDRFRKMPGFNVSIADYVLRSSYHFMMNLRNPILGKVKVRQAMAYAIDKGEILQKALFGIGYMSEATLEWYVPLKTKYSRNIAKANQLLDEAGYPRDGSGTRFSTSIICSTGGIPFKIAEVIREQLREVGIDLKIRPMEPAAVTDLVWKRLEFDIDMDTISSGPDPMAVSKFYHSSQIGKGSSTNCMSYNNSRVDYLLDVAAYEPDLNKRKEYYSELQEIVANEVPSILLAPWLVTDVYKTDFAGIPAGISFRDPFDKIWWVKGSEASPEAIQSAITAAGKELEGLRGQFYDVTAALQQLEQAKKALEAGDYVKANELAKGAVKLAQPPYAMYGGLAVAVIAVIGGAALYLKRRKQKTTTK